MLLVVNSPDKTAKVKLLFAAVLVLASLVGVSPNSQADTYQEATTGRKLAVGISFFGTHFHRLVLKPGEKWLLTRWPDAGIGAIRLWDSGVWWAGISPRPGQWVFDRPDAYVQYAMAHHAEVLFVLGGGTPRWASARPDERCSYGFGCAAEPVRMAHWEEYVRRVVQRYHGRIKAYELWNEPRFSDIPRDKNGPSFYTGDVANMVEMARIARKVLDEYDPEAVLATPGFVNGSDRLELFLSSGGKKYVKAIAYHLYSENSDHFIRQVLEVRAIMKRQGVENLPLWNTEAGVDVVGPADPPSGIAAHSQKESAEKLAQYMILGASVGLEHFYHYAWDNPRSGMMNQFGVPLPALAAYEKLQAWLLGSRMLGCKKLLPQAVYCEGERAGARFAIAWSEINGAYAFPAPSGWEVGSHEYLLDSGAVTATPSGQANHSRFELGPQPLYIQYKPLPSLKAN